MLQHSTVFFLTWIGDPLILSNCKNHEYYFEVKLLWFVGPYLTPNINATHIRLLFEVGLQVRWLDSNCKCNQYRSAVNLPWLACSSVDVPSITNITNTRRLFWFGLKIRWFDSNRECYECHFAVNVVWLAGAMTWTSWQMCHKYSTVILIWIETPLTWLE